VKDVVLPAIEDRLQLFETVVQVYADCEVADDELRVIKCVEFSGLV
jgi:hypothetical protein